jgi:chlorophyll synthase
MLFLELGRPFTMLSAFLVGVFLGLIVDAGWSSILLGLLFSAAQGFGQAVNQITDVEIDRINKPYRPIPSGRITPEKAMDYALIYYGLGLLFSIPLGVRGYISYLLVSFFAFFYSAKPLRMKEAGAWSSLIWQALSRGFLPPVIAAFIFKANYGIITLSVLAFMWVLALQSTKDFGDIEGDKKQGVKTLPIVYGVDGARKIMSFLILSYTLVLLLFISRGLIPKTLAGLVPVALLALYGVGYSSPTENNFGWNLFYIGLALHYVLWLGGEFL